MKIIAKRCRGFYKSFYCFKQKTKNGGKILSSFQKEIDITVIVIDLGKNQRSLQSIKFESSISLQVGSLVLIASYTHQTISPVPYRANNPPTEW